MHLHNCLCEFRGFKIGRSSHRRCSIKKSVRKNFAKMTGKNQSLFFNKDADLRPATLLKERLRHRCFSVSFAKFLRTFFYRTPRGVCFWITLMVKKFISAWLIFLIHSLIPILIHTNNSSCSIGVITIILV